MPKLWLSRRPSVRPARRSRPSLERLETRALLTTLPYGAIVSGSIDGPAATQVYTFNATKGDQFTLAMTGTATEAGFDAYADLYAPSKTGVDSFGVAGQRYYTAKESGTYSVQVHDYDSAETGTFTLGLEGIKPVSPNPTPLVPGGIVGGAIGAAIDVKQFTFAGHVGDQITLAMTSTPAQANFDAYADFFAPSGKGIDSFGAAGQRYYTLKETGTFMVQVHDYDYAQKGAFTIGLEGIHPISPKPIALVPGGFVTGTTSAGIDVKQYTFHANEDDIFAVSLTGTATQAGFDAYADLWAPSGEGLDSFGVAGLRYYTAKESGTFMLQLHDYDYGQAGKFKIGLESIKPASPDALALRAGRGVAGIVGQSNDDVQFVFFGRQNDVVKFTLSGTPIQSGFDVYADLFGPSGTGVDSFGAATARSETLKETGWQLLQVHDYDFGQAGKFTIQIDWAAPVAASISGSVYDDVNADGVRGGTEVGLAGRLLYLDTNGNGKPDASERQTKTDVVGNYAFTALSAGTYAVREVLPAKWFATSPPGASIPVTVKAGQNAAQNFGNSKSVLATAAVSGRVFNDANGDGHRNKGELGLGAWKVYLDTNGNGKLDNGEKYVLTDIYGNWTLGGLVSGRYTVRVVQLAGTKTTGPTGASFTVTLRAAQKVKGYVFAEQSLT